MALTPGRASPCSCRRESTPRQEQGLTGDQPAVPSPWIVTRWPLQCKHFFAPARRPRDACRRPEVYPLGKGDGAIVTLPGTDVCTPRDDSFALPLIGFFRRFPQDGNVTPHERCDLAGFGVAHLPTTPRPAGANSRGVGLGHLKHKPSPPLVPCRGINSPERNEWSEPL